MPISILPLLPASRVPVKMLSTSLIYLLHVESATDLPLPRILLLSMLFLLPMPMPISIFDPPPPSFLLPAYSSHIWMRNDDNNVVKATSRLVVLSAHVRSFVSQAAATVRSWVEQPQGASLMSTMHVLLLLPLKAKLLPRVARQVLTKPPCIR